MSVKKGTDLTLTVVGDIVDIIPMIITPTNDMDLVFKGNTYHLKRGPHTYDDVVITEGRNDFVFRYNGDNSYSTVSLKMTGGKF